MISEKYADMTTKGSIIREFAQYASKRAAEIGKENVYNFTIGNPSVPVCPEFTETLERMLKEENPLTLHGYSPTLGIMSTFTHRLSFTLSLTVQANLSQRSIQSKSVFTY